MKRFLENLNHVLNYLGFLLILLSILLLLPIVISLLTGEYFQNLQPARVFLFSAAVSFILGSILKLLFKKKHINSLQAVLVCSVGWITLSFIGALPYFFLTSANFF
ncbi:MAG: hypothetical protein SVM86_02945, partial [Candidatus Cloacimonadota bacterium]|nr:hypothetical protein [Candidatus Cloacimonadota bacterium]